MNLGKLPVFSMADGPIPGEMHLSDGQEPVAVGVCAHLEASDIVTATHRPHHQAIAKGSSNAFEQLKYLNQTPDQKLVLAAIERVLHNADERHPDEFTFDGRNEASVEGLLSDFLHLKGTMQLQHEVGDRVMTPKLAAELGREFGA